MDRYRNYFFFAVCCAGLGYIALWALAGYGGHLFGVSINPQALPPALQLAGTLSAIFVGLRALLLASRRLRGPAPAILPMAAAPSCVPRRQALRQVATVKPRAQFGLRGAPRH